MPTTCRRAKKIAHLNSVYLAPRPAHAAAAIQRAHVTAQSLAETRFS